MMKSVSALAVMMALSMTAAVAKDLKQDKAPPAPAVKAKVMSDAEMDKVTAGDVGLGVLTAASNGDGQPQSLAGGNSGKALFNLTAINNVPNNTLGAGRCTAKPGFSC